MYKRTKGLIDKNQTHAPNCTFIQSIDVFTQLINEFNYWFIRLFYIIWISYTFAWFFICLIHCFNQLTFYIKLLNKVFIHLKCCFMLSSIYSHSFMKKSYSLSCGSYNHGIINDFYSHKPDYSNDSNTFFYEFL